MISEDYTTTYTSVNIGSDGKNLCLSVILDQTLIQIHIVDSVLTYRYKPSNEKALSQIVVKDKLVGAVESD
jgi:hypothetical protein